MMSRVRYITLFEYNPVFEKIQILFKGNLLREHDLFMYSFLKPQILWKKPLKTFFYLQKLGFKYTNRSL